MRENAMIYKIAIALFMVCLSRWADAGPLHDAAKAGDVAQIQLLLDQGADINESSETATALYIAINTQHAGAAELLIERGADVNASSSRGTPLHAAASKGMAPIATKLLEKGADPNAAWSTLTPLHLAAKYGHIDVARVLLDHGANINALTSSDEPPLHLAIITKHPDIADLLRERGAKAPAVETIDVASADPEHGSQVVVPCRACHSIDRQARGGSVPPLWDIVGRPKAGYAGFAYSDAMKAETGSWTYTELNNYLAHPALTVPGTSMMMEGIHAQKDRADLIAFLRTLSDHPAPLP